MERACCARIRDGGLTKRFDYTYYPYTAMLEDQVNGIVDSWAIRWYASCFLRQRADPVPRRVDGAAHGIRRRRDPCAGRRVPGGSRDGPGDGLADTPRGARAREARAHALSASTPIGPQDGASARAEPLDRPARAASCLPKDVPVHLGETLPDAPRGVAVDDPLGRTDRNGDGGPDQLTERRREIIDVARAPRTARRRPASRGCRRPARPRPEARSPRLRGSRPLASPWGSTRPADRRHASARRCARAGCRRERDAVGDPQGHGSLSEALEAVARADHLQGPSLRGSEASQRLEERGHALGVRPVEVGDEQQTARPARPDEREDGRSTCRRRWGRPRTAPAHRWLRSHPARNRVTGSTRSARLNAQRASRSCSGGTVKKGNCR